MASGLNVLGFHISTDRIKVHGDGIDISRFALSSLAVLTAAITPPFIMGSPPPNPTPKKNNSGSCQSIPKGTIDFNIYYTKKYRHTISFLLPDGTFLNYFFYPKRESHLAYQNLPRVGALASKDDRDLEDQKGRNPSEATQASLIITKSKMTGQVCPSQTLYQDATAKIDILWLKDGVRCRQIVLTGQDGKVVPSFACGEVRVVGCPIDDQGIPDARFVFRQTKVECALKRLMKKLFLNIVEEDWTQPPKDEAVR